MSQFDEAVKKAFSFDLRHVRRRFVNDTGATEEAAARLERELLRFLVLGGVNPTGNYEMAGPVDTYWHTFLLFTREYQEFCQLIAGRFLHHVPGNPEGDRGDGTGYRRFLKDYERLFQEPPPADIWPFTPQSTGIRVVDAERISSKGRG